MHRSGWAQFAGQRAVSNVVLIGLTSMFVDLSTEMVYPIVPIFLTATLGATPMVVGVIEGIAESLASLLKVFSGYLGDARQHRKRLTFVGTRGDRKSTRLNSSHVSISYAVFCL